MQELIFEILEAIGFVFLGAFALLIVADLTKYPGRTPCRKDREIHESDIPPYKIEPTDRLPKAKK